MKKLFISILAVLYITSSAGATVYMHYCMGKLVDTALKASDETSCGNCSSEDDSSSCSKDCCDHEQKTVRNDHDHKLADNTLSFYQSSFDSPVHTGFVYSITALPSIVSEGYPLSHAPPGRERCSIHILHAIFLI